MATRPTRLQDQAGDQLADALLLITEAARRDGRGPFNADDLAEVALRLARASSAFSLDAIVARALERRGRALGLRPGTADLILLLEGTTSPLELLLQTDAEFSASVATLEAELGEM